MILALVLGATAALHSGRLPPAPAHVWDVTWVRTLVAPEVLEWHPREPGGPAIDAATGTVVVGARNGKLRAFDARGKRLWTFEAEKAFDAQPRVHGGTVYAGSRDGRLYAVALDSGRERWRYDAREEVSTRPVVAAGLVIVTTLQDTVVAVDAQTGAWKWHHRRDLPRGFTIRGAAGPTVSGGVVYAAYSDGHVAALKVENGQVVWERLVAPPGQFLDVDSTPVVHGGRVYVAAYSGAVLALDAGSGRVEWESKVPGAARVALAGEALVVVTTTQVLGLDPADGRVLWTTPFSGTPSGQPLVVGTRVAVPSTKSLMWFDSATGRVIATLDPGTGISGTPAVEGDRMYVLTNGSALVALDLAP
ncbi:MAG TPA: PQQ-binding-like beta-propeller repeat protein [Anaeromyxobacteraceae bacterium]|nr:PQQ-binding-like beta-propeller repeat protein [Anaeromyxobacteraceae bacterium]